MKQHPRRTYANPMSLLRIERILTALQPVSEGGMGPMTARQIAERLFMGDRTAARVTQHMRLKRKIIYISGWNQNSRGRFSPVFSPGSLPDAPKPNSRTDVEYSREYRKRIYSDPEMLDRYRAKKRADWHRRKLLKKKSSWIPLPIQAQEEIHNEQ
jgi:hypothetical protein